MQELIIPEDVLSQHVIAFGKPGSGKSSKLRVLDTVKELRDRLTDNSRDGAAREESTQ